MKNFMENATMRQRVVLFVIVIVLIIGGVIAAIIFTTPPSTHSEGRTNNGTGTSITSSPTPSASQAYIPKDEFDARAHASASATPIPTPTGTFSEGNDAGPGVAAAENTAQNGVMAWCPISAGETWTQRQAAMKPYFDPASSIYSTEDIDSSIYERYCTFTAVSDAQKASAAAPDYTVYVTVSTGFRLDKGDPISDAKLTQYQVTVGPNGIVDIND